MIRPDPILIGYFPKITACPDSTFGVTSVKEICSVSTCISEAPDDWIDLWKHNLTWWLYDTEQLARSIVETNAALYDIYAYKIFPVVFDENTETPISVEASATGNLSDFDFLGYDAVSREDGVSEFCHSPLSCNGGWEKYKVNRYCLIDDLDEAWRITSEIARDANEKNLWEPGKYYLCGVYRKRK